jgi:hypothetical protein
MKIGGVPEHYNAPIHGALQALNSSDYTWKSFPSGTGAMLDALDAGEIDLAILLTEGVTKHALTTNRSKIVGTFVDNPLPWGVHVSPSSGLTTMLDLNKRIESLTFGISRLGSGSHLMAIVHASRLGVRSPQFKIVDTMKGARDALLAQEINVFLWDIATADVFAREGVWTCIGTVSGDWPAFVFATSSNFSMKESLSKFLSAVESESLRMKTERNVHHLMSSYNLTETQAVDFFDSIKWNGKSQIDFSAMNRVVQALISAGIIPDQCYDVSSIINMV